MSRYASAPLFILSLLSGLLLAQTPPPDRVGHEHHRHPHGQPHPRDEDAAGRFVTNRTARELELPAEEDAFTFIVFGDRTGGPPGGVAVLADAVRDANLFEPDLVMTVGDMVQGYNQTEAWLAQTAEFKAIMDELLCPWFPVAGNHDVYWRGPDKPPGEHEASYETHFGPLWYAFAHKGSWFIVLYTDEGDPETGLKGITQPDRQRMSPEQLAWLDETLTLARDAEHVFVFVHHPRWLGGGYGDDWQRVHERLAAAGNVRAVFGGHIHRMQYTGPRDGIEDVTLATTGGGNSLLVPRAGWLHHFHVVTVRQQQIAMAAVPVGEVLDVRGLTGELVAQIEQLAHLRPQMSPPLAVSATGAASGKVAVTITNPAEHPVEATLHFGGADSRWFCVPDHIHGRLEPGTEQVYELIVERPASSLDTAYRPLELVLDLDVLTPAFRVPVPPRTFSVPLELDLPAPPVPADDHALILDGRQDHLELASRHLPLPDGPITLECRFRADSLSDRIGLVSKMEMSDYGLMFIDRIPAFYVLLGNDYASARATDIVLEPNRWYHIAGVYDGSEIRLYLDGRQVAAAPASGGRRRNQLPLLIGADVNGSSQPMSFFHGAIDAVHLSKTARYTADNLTQEGRPTADEHTLLLLNMDATVGRWLYDESPQGAHPVIRGRPRTAAVPR